ncbi:histone H3-like centromeric protein cid [Drosophila innubila]|uniref:histone H3-like centromeric protein cid n=1 Tax=Drosophila innubila TaxID=198719 RepID=UPI00148CFA1B|nr:histone H3-like centromeric protein cid [Drosophila innubila]
MNTTHSSGSDASGEESDLTAAFNTAQINATHRRSSTINEPDEFDLTAAINTAQINATHRRSSRINEQATVSEHDQSDAEEGAIVEPVEENGNAREEVPPPRNTRPRRRKQRHPLSRAQALALEIRKLQLSPNYMIPRLCFGRVVRELLISHGTDSSIRITMSALEALQTASEMYLTQRFQDAYMLTMHRGRVTLENRDMALMAYMCSKFGHL